MALNALKPGYTGERMDRVENFGGNQVVYLGWDEHRMFCSAKAFPLPPEMPFQALLDQIVPAGFAQHPEFELIDWDSVTWLLNGTAFTPDMSKSLIEQGIDHKSLLRFQTPGLNGYQGAGV